MIQRLRRRFVTILMAIVTAMLCIIFGLVIHFTAQSMESQSLRMMQTVLPEIGVPPGLEQRPDIMLPYFSVTLGRDGSILATGGYSGLVEEGLLPELLESVLASESESDILKEHDLRFRKMLMPMGQRVVFADITAEKAVMEDLIKTCVGIGVLALLVFWFISIRLARWAVGPVEEAWQQQKQFVADASHELKTPLTVIMTNAELLQSQTPGQPAESILTMSRQMRTLVEGMLELARVDNGSVRTSFRQLDLSQLIGEDLMLFEPIFYEKGLMLEESTAPDVAVTGSPDHIRQVLAILLDNALKYSHPGGTVRVKLEKWGNHALLSVENPGPAITREDLGNIFKRFYRVDKARSRDGSYGLGLSIAGRIVEEHRGRIWAESEGGINTFFVQLPLL